MPFEFVDREPISVSEPQSRIECEGRTGIEAARGLRVLVTGASGLLGSHLAEQWVQAGAVVRTLLRSHSPAPFLDSLGVEKVHGNLRDPIACRFACEGMDIVCHAAAKVGDWGPWHEFQEDTVEATRQIADAARHAGIGRFVHISSTSAYGHPDDSESPIREDYSLGTNIWRNDPYTLAKVECERQLWKMAKTGFPLTVIRPSWLYGPRDRITLDRLVSKMRSGKFRLIGPGDNRLQAIDATEVARAAMMAALAPQASGRAYNVTDLGPITQKDYFGLVATSFGMPPTTKHANYPLAFFGGGLLERWGRLVHPQQPPLITRYAAWLMGRRLWYDNARIRDEIGWRPAVDYPESVRRTAAWFLADRS
jgi:nucleoside-diphosphate-sugar epimerase